MTDSFSLAEAIAYAWFDVDTAGELSIISCSTTVLPQVIDDGSPRPHPRTRYVDGHDA